MDEQSTSEYIKSLQEIESNLQKALSKHDEINYYFREVLTAPNVPANSLFIKQAEAKFTKNMLQMIESIQKAAPEIQKFNTKVMYASRERLVELDGKKTVVPTNNNTIVGNFLIDDLGKFQHAIVEQIQIIDSEKRENSSYAELNEAISARIYYTNKTMDSCIDYLLKNL